MHADRADLRRIADHGDHPAEAWPGCELDLLCHPHLAYSLAADILARVDAVLGGEPIARAVAEPAEIRIAEGTGYVAGHQPVPAAAGHYSGAGDEVPGREGKPDQPAESPTAPPRPEAGNECADAVARYHLINLCGAMLPAVVPRAPGRAAMPNLGPPVGRDLPCRPLRGPEY